MNLVNAAEILGLSYRQAKRIWRRDGIGTEQAEEIQLNVLRLVRQK